MIFASDLGRPFFIAALLPAALFVLLNRFVLWPLLPARWQAVLVMPEVGIEGAAWLGGAALLLGVLLAASNTTLIQLLAGIHPLIRKPAERWLAHVRARHQARYGTLLQLRDFAAQQPESRQGDIRVNLIRFHSKALSEQAADPLSVLPLDPRHLRPTALGNVLATIEEYSTARYGLDLNLFWPRLLPLLPERLIELLRDSKTRADFWLNLAVLSQCLAAEAVLLALLQGALALRGGAEPLASLFNGLGLIGLAVLALGAALASYRATVYATLELGEFMKSAFDLYRDALRVTLGLAPAPGLAAEQAQWQNFGNYLLSGESFFAPKLPVSFTPEQLLSDQPPVSGPELLANLQDLLRRSLNRQVYLETQAAQHDPNNVPYTLTAAIEEASRAVAQVEARLRALEQTLLAPQELA
jgi:hypothetical protein